MSSAIPTHLQRLVLQARVHYLQLIAPHFEANRTRAEFGVLVDSLKLLCQDFDYKDATSRLEELARLVRAPGTVLSQLYLLWNHLLDLMDRIIDASNRQPREWGWAIGMAGYWGGWCGQVFSSRFRR